MTALYGSDTVSPMTTDTTDTTDVLLPDDGVLFVEIVLPDGSVACWAREVEVDGEVVIDDHFIDNLTNAVEAFLGSPDTLRA